jgi:hypothetical protein
MMRTALSVRVALGVGLALAATALLVVLFRHPLVVAGTNSVPAHVDVSGAPGGSSGCQPAATLPRGTTAIRVSVSSNTGPSLDLRMYSGSQLIAHGNRSSGWGVDETVTVPINRASRAVGDTRLCITFGRSVEPIQINGAYGASAGTFEGKPIRAVMLRVEYLRPGPSSWFSLASSVASRMGLGHAAAGTWVVFVLLATMIAITLLASRLIVREQ